MYSYLPLAGERVPGPGSCPERRNAAVCLLVNELSFTAAVVSCLLLSGFRLGWLETETRIYMVISSIQLLLGGLLVTLAFIRWERVSFRLLLSYGFLSTFRLLVLLILAGTVIAWWYSIIFFFVCLIPTSCFVARLQDGVRRRRRHSCSSSFPQGHSHCQRIFSQTQPPPIFVSSTPCEFPSALPYFQPPPPYDQNSQTR